MCLDGTVCFPMACAQVVGDEEVGVLAAKLLRVRLRYFDAGSTPCSWPRPSSPLFGAEHLQTPICLRPRPRGSLACPRDTTSFRVHFCGILRLGRSALRSLSCYSEKNLPRKLRVSQAVLLCLSI